MSTPKTSARPTTIMLHPDVYEILKVWARQNLTSMSAEVAAAVRERAAREQRECVAA